jgi:hypothetical protein
MLPPIFVDEMLLCLYHHSARLSPDELVLGEFVELVSGGVSVRLESGADLC